LCVTLDKRAWRSSQCDDGVASGAEADVAVEDAAPLHQLLPALSLTELARHRGVLSARTPRAPRPAHGSYSNVRARHGGAALADRFLGAGFRGRFIWP
jgi:hypothetical protein